MQADVLSDLSCHGIDQNLEYVQGPHEELEQPPERKLPRDLMAETPEVFLSNVYLKEKQKLIHSPHRT